jgi:DNA invertase Pin-like site-specific DNA recombinase
MLDDFRERPIKFRSVTENIDTQTAAGRAMWQIIALLAELERSQIRERTQAGIAAAREGGVQFGRKMKLSLIRCNKSRNALNQERYPRTLPIFSTLAGTPSAEHSRAEVYAVLSVQQAFFKQLQTQSHSFAVVQRKDTHRSPPNRRETFD